MNFLTALAQLVAGLYGAHKVTSKLVEEADDWFKLSLSLFGTGFVCFFGSLGIVGGAAFTAATTAGVHPWLAFVISLGGGFFAACLSMAVGVSYLWKRSPLTRGIPLLSPMKVEEKVLEGGYTLTVPADSTGGKS
jgi:hypothetical protein